MSMRPVVLHARLVAGWQWIETWLVGPVKPSVRHNMRMELAATVAYGTFATVLAFLPVVLRRLGASVDRLALYNASTYLGSILAGVGLYLTRPGYAKRTVVICWLLARGAFLLVAFTTNDIGLLALAAIFWLMDGLPSPAYSAIIQSVYPIEHRGKVLALVRLGVALPMLALTLIVGWTLDRLGYRVLFPVAGVFGVLGALLFSRLRVNEAQVLPRQARASGSVRGILGNDRRFALYLFSLLLFGLGSLVPSALVPLIQVDRLHLSYGELGWLNLILSLVRLPGYFYWGRRIDRWGGVQSLQIMFVINAVYLFPYIWASRGWMLVPSFIATGLVSAGVDLAFISVVIQLAGPTRVSEYAALQATLIGLRGMLGPFIGVGLLRLGLSESAIFAIAIALTLLAALNLNRVKSASLEPASQRGLT